MSKPNQPQDKWGFYAQVPRIVRTKYKQLSHAEKWLYTCLKDLCGDKGQCFRSLRSLSQETDISTGSLSKMVPHLHESGLIHAEKKKRTESGKEIWHITITDIWKANAAYCSNSEQSKHEKEVVQNLNVQNLNDDCSKSEPDCSNFVDRRIQEKNTNLEEDKASVALPANGKVSDVDVSPAHIHEKPSVENTPSKQAASHSQNNPAKTTSKPKQTIEDKPAGPPPVPQMPPAEMPWGTRKCMLKFDAWRGVPLLVDWKLQKASKTAKQLASYYSEDQVDVAKARMDKDPYYIERGGADLFDVANNIAKYLKIIDNETKKSAPVTNTKQIVETVANIAGYTQKTIDLALSQQDAPAMRHLGPRRNRKGA